MSRCKNCGAVVNPKWDKCFACGLPINLNKSTEPTITKEQIVKMPLKEFNSSNLAVKVYSEVLGREIWFVSNEKIRDKVATSEGLATYLPHELMHFVKIGATPEELKKIHMVKEIFPGSKGVSIEIRRG